MAFHFGLFLLFFLGLLTGWIGLLAGATEPARNLDGQCEVASTVWELENCDRNRIPDQSLLKGRGRRVAQLFGQCPRAEYCAMPVNQLRGQLVEEALWVFVLYRRGHVVLCRD